MNTEQSYPGKGDSTTLPTENTPSFEPAAQNPEQSVNTGSSSVNPQNALFKAALESLSLEDLLESDWLTDFEKERLEGLRAAGTNEASVADFARLLIGLAMSEPEPLQPAPPVPPAATQSERQPTGLDIQVTDDATILRIESSFGILMQDSERINIMRQDLRSWFTAYLPVWEGSYSPATLEESTTHYEMLDDFLSALITGDIRHQKAALRPDTRKSGITAQNQHLQARVEQLEKDLDSAQKLALSQADALERLSAPTADTDQQSEKGGQDNA